MWAILDYDNKTVIGLITPDIDITLPEVQKEIDGRIAIKMNINNSPGYVGGTYENEKFYPPKELING
jgi:hypothetical protein